MTAAKGEGQAPRQGEPAISPRTRVVLLTVRRALIMIVNAIGDLMGLPPVRIASPGRIPVPRLAEDQSDPSSSRIDRGNIDSQY